MKKPPAAGPAGGPGKSALSALRLWGALFSRFRRPPPIGDRRAVADFIDRHSAHAAQSALYGYLKTRAGFEYFRLFDDEGFLRSVNIAKWNIYAACAGDLAVFCGAHLRRRLSAPADKVAPFMEAVIVRVFAQNPAPPDAGEDYPRLAEESRTRVRNAPWAQIADDESAFVRSPAALVHWAPVADSLKGLDAPIVENSISFMWKETRDKFRRRADAQALRSAMEMESPDAPDRRRADG